MEASKKKIVPKDLKETGATVEITPPIKKRLEILLPKIFPTTSLASFLKTPATEVASSGKEVPKATKVKPRKDWEIFNNLAKRATFLTKKSPLKINPPIPKGKSKIFQNFSFFDFKTSFSNHLLSSSSRP